MTVDSQPIYGDCEPIDWTVYDQTGHDTPGCDCGHDGMGRAWHASDCAWSRGIDLARVENREPSGPRWAETVDTTDGGATIRIPIYAPDGSEIDALILDRGEAIALRDALNWIIGDEVVPVPREAFDGLVKAAMHVSLGRSAAFITSYPDAVARAALGALDDAGLITREQQ